MAKNQSICQIIHIMHERPDIKEKVREIMSCKHKDSVTIDMVQKMVRDKLQNTSTVDRVTEYLVAETMMQLQYSPPPPPTPPPALHNFRAMVESLSADAIEYNAAFSNIKPETVAALAKATEADLDKVMNE